MRRARILYQGTVHDVTVERDGTLRAGDGSRFGEDEVTWLPPKHGTVLALGLNYADHAAELASRRPDEPLVFVKAASSLTGHRRPCCRPDGVENMHFEAELVAVIGRAARKVKRGEALEYVSAYTVCNDFAVRDYLENYYRPNLRVKCRDSLTPLGPWLVDAGEVGDPHDLAIRTFVNGELRQSGSTREMIFDIPYLVEYLSAFMTLMPGDMISTGTPQGVSNVNPGDEVTVEVENVGRLTNRIVSEEEYERLLAADPLMTA
jgi:5-oxopent-3-ene-1,2,5-tricarboxylate decarboxylase/2-hydroxyhepta-2,4-diene-1,7-dioate isomerase